MAKSKLRGHEIECINGDWYYSDTKEKTTLTYKLRPCAKCGRFPDEKEHDPCISNLPGVMNACCGHGEDNLAYVQFWDGRCIRGNEAVKLMGILKESGKNNGYNK